MTADEIQLLATRRAGFDDFHKAVLPTLVEFVGLVGVDAPQTVIRAADRVVPQLDRALRNLATQGEQERLWLTLRVGQFIGEYFVQKYAGCWFVNDIAGARFFARYVVGQFSGLSTSVPLIDPFEVAAGFVDAPAPRSLSLLLNDLNVELVQMSKRQLN